ncbi:MAG: alpha/beta fold hydrolase [Zoogloeaceae bacterium]|jgi:polyhydroxyalkanoate synthase|nr:alpha/beta fold hydrolase [Zoogloeaceae bacterium]
MNEKASLPQAHSGVDHSGIDLSEASPLEALGEKISKQLDPFGVLTSMMGAHMAWMMHPLELGRVVSALSGDFLALQSHIARRAIGLPSEDVVLPYADDTRFSDPVWSESPTWDIIKEWYLAFSHRMQDMYFETPGMSGKERRRSAFWLRKWLNAVSPSNFFWTNPVALRKFVETRGNSVMAGVRNFYRDARAKNILTVDSDAFVVGKDLATTPGKVIFRNRLLEIIHYEPTTEKTRAVPVLFVTPWINKFYILDLTSKKSLLKYLVDQGFSVFVTSWKNPTADMSALTFDDYLTEGVDTAVHVVLEYCAQPKLHLVGYCIGGTLSTTYLAWSNRRFGVEKTPIADMTLFTTLTDFSHPGEVEVFIDQASVGALEESMEKKGYLDGNEMASAFRLLRSNSLIWNYWVHSYLYGEPLAPFDVLFWNADSTRMPHAMHSYYLREMYLNNNLIKHDQLTIAGETISLHRIVQPVYAVTAVDDHIAPWAQCYRIRKYLDVNAPLRFVLSTSGHILGIVNPPVNPPKRAYWSGEPKPNERYSDWVKRTPKKSGSWWEEWKEWLKERGGEEIAARSVGTRKYPALADAPGTYVLEK